LDAARSSLAPGLGRWTGLALAALLCAGTLLRLRSLDEGSLFIDEGESSLNALSILENGYPADRYLGLPMFENTLTEAWPESPEYEFRDTSYSSRGMAIYHGWLPLYAIAASLHLHGIRPDALSDPPRVQHGADEIRTRIRAARLPGVFFGALFLGAIFAAGRSMYGNEAGLGALLVAALSPKCIWLAQQARYYSAALALSTLAVYTAWRVHRHGRWGDFAAAGIAFALLFHTSSLAFAIVLAPCALLLPGALRHARAWAKLSLAAGIVGLGIVPWMVWSGYLEHAERIPMARSFLDFPEDYLVYSRMRSTRILVGAALVLAFLGAWRLRARLPRRFAEPIAAAGLPVLFSVLWIASAYLGFQLLVPAASCSMARLSHALLAGPILLGTLWIAVLARGFLPGHSALVSLAGSLTVLFALGGLAPVQQRNPHEARAVFEMVEVLRGLELRADTRIYALPYQHFCLAYYTGLPIQTIAPVRREFLDEHPGEILILETVHRLPSPLVSSVERQAARAGITLDRAEAAEWVPRLHAEMIRAEVVPLVREVLPPAGPLPPWVAPVADGLRSEVLSTGQGRIDFALDNPAMFEDLPPMTLDEFWPAFFYRFVGPEGRTGEHLNYSGRMRGATALLLPSSWIVLRCPPPMDAP
jgi:hypothetical protein